ncbi:YggN family protein [Microbulbifer sp. CAU 1566]|uniref:DUF2884 family protein n=1 Tax=Microbulbifer sp. CAU 1566 TaxID=2933269 RepID=UPI002003A7C9|nr:DUF2884 family protein [Microbulbifer sp. CAU 1566]MCK7596551.1 YggN family protein [Microbulbifer sp. CAU 1566]
MKKICILAAALIAAPAATMAHQINLSSDTGEQCNANINHRITVGPDFIEARDADDLDQLLFAYRAPDQLAVGDDGLILSPEQQQLMAKYQQGLHQSGREITLISAEAMNIALDGVGIAMSALAGPDNPDTLEFISDSEQLKEKLLAQVHQNGDVYTLGGPEIDAGLEETFERELEPRLEALAKRSAGTIAWHAMKAVFTGGRSIERDAEAAAEAAEEAIEKKAETLESHADALCALLEEIDATETTLHKAIPQLQKLDLISMNPHKD